ncbi:hypothetical protein [Bacillus altitudinis]|nr:hypothetical protein [Bacillus altitudinis]
MKKVFALTIVAAAIFFGGVVAGTQINSASDYSTAGFGHGA